MFNKIGIKVTVFVNIALLIVIVAGGYYIVGQQGKSLEARLLERGGIESIVGARMIGQIMEEAIDNGVFSINDAFDTDYELIPGFEPAKYHTKYDFYLDKAILSLQDEFLRMIRWFLLLLLTKTVICQPIIPVINSRLPVTNRRIWLAIEPSEFSMIRLG